MDPRSPIVADLFQEEIYEIKDRVLIVLAEPWESVSPEDKLLLSKILGAVKLHMDGVQIINQPSFTPEALKTLSPKWAIRFSSDASDSLPYYEATAVDECKVIKSHPLAELDDARKKNLWMALKGLLAS